MVYSYTMKRISIYLWNWLPALLWMFLIFFLSQRQRIALSEEYVINFFIFKSLHVIEYAILYFLLFRGFYLSFRKISSHTLDKLYKYTFLISLIYALSDELHQSFVPTREGKFRDVVIDTLGIVIMYTFLKSRLSLIKKYL